MITEKRVKVTNHGMISIPAYYREKYQIHDGDHLSMIEDENGLRIIPIIPIEELRKNGPTVEELRIIMQKCKEEELELEK